MGEPSGRPLFRHEAIEFQQHSRQWGRVVSLQPRSTRLTVWFITAAVAAVIAFLFVAQYARKETVSGYLVPGSGTARVFATQPGIVSAIYVEQGERVEEGQPLLTVTTSQIAAGGEDVNATILDSLAQQKDALTRRMAAEEDRTASERERLTAVIAGIETAMMHLKAQIALQRERIQISEKLVSHGAQLGPMGLIPEVEQRRREAGLLEQEQSFYALSQQLADQQNKLTEARYSLQQLPTVIAEKILSLRNELTAADQRIAEVNGRRAYIIRAPLTGRISTLQASVGQAADPQRLQLQIVPAESPLQVELFVPTRAIGFVEVGQDVRILYDAFPYQHFGTYRGRIIKISQTILTSSDIAMPVTLKEPAYRATVALERQDVDAYGKKVALQPDMLLRADIILERRTLVDWILNPLLSTRIQG
jgi:membrane fusion protein